MCKDYKWVYFLCLNYYTEKGKYRIIYHGITLEICGGEVKYLSSFASSVLDPPRCHRRLGSLAMKPNKTGVYLLQT